MGHGYWPVLTTRSPLALTECSLIYLSTVQATGDKSSSSTGPLGQGISSAISEKDGPDYNKLFLSDINPAGYLSGSWE